MGEFSGRRILVTGGEGFTGSWLTRRLVEQGAEVTVLLAGYRRQSLFVASGLIDQVTVATGRLEDFQELESLLRNGRIESVFHLAAMSLEGMAFENPLLAFESNIRGTYNLLEACRRAKVERVIIASSDKAYGESDRLPYTEDLTLAGRHPYDVSKSCADLLAQAYYHSYRLPVAIGRFGNIYGGGDLNFSRLIPGTTKRVLYGEAPIIKRHAGGAFKRDFLYVEDVIDGYLAMHAGLAREEIHGQAFNFALGGTWSVPEVVHKIQSITQTTHIVPQTIQAPHAEIKYQHVSAAKAQKVLNWSPRTSFDAGLVHTVKWYRAFMEGHIDFTAAEGGRFAFTAGKLQPAC